MTSLLPPRWHPALYGVLAAAIVAYALVTRRSRFAASRSQQGRFAGAIVLLLVAYGWPLGDLARHVSLSALVVQRLLVILAVAPLLITSIPHELGAAATRPTLLDRVGVAVCHPAVAIVVVTVVGTVTLTPAVVGWAAGSGVATTGIALVTVGIGIVLWLPILAAVPGARRLGHVGQGAYLMVASLVVTSLSFVWIFSKHPMYSSFHDQHALLAMSPVVDQQLAGFIAKLGAYFPMWSIAFVLFSRAGDSEVDEIPLRWVDVQRELERAERRERHEPAQQSGL
jgi:cytochrome c oxidase assembly factor CtaG